MGEIFDKLRAERRLRREKKRSRKLCYIKKIMDSLIDPNNSRCKIHETVT